MEGSAVSMAVVCLFLSFAHLVAAGDGCPDGCYCDFSIAQVKCDHLANVSWPEFYRALPLATQKLILRGASLATIPKPSRKQSVFKDLTSITIEDSDVSSVQQGAFQLFPSLQTLNLAFNNITMMNDSSFTGLEDFKVLNLSNNGITYLPKDFLTDLPRLEVLDLSHNDLDTIPIMRSMDNLRNVNLSYSNIKYLHPNTFANSPSLDVLDLRGNKLDTLHKEIFTNVTVKALYLSENPWDCNCGIAWLVEELNYISGNYKDQLDIKCQTPYKDLGKLISTIDPSSLYCDSPTIQPFLPKNQSIQYLHSSMLHCNVSDLASVYWITPRGVLVHPDQRRWLPPSITEYSHILIYSGKPTNWKATVEALSNGSLEIKRFRNYFVGEYTCVAENPEGVATVSVTVSIFSVMNTIMDISTAIGYTMAFGVMVAGIIIGLTRWFAERHCKCCKPQSKKKPPSTGIEAKDEAVGPSTSNFKFNDVFMEKHWTNDGTFHYEYDPTMRSPSLSPRMSPTKCVTPAEYAEDFANDDDALAPPHLTDDIKELLILVRASLRHGLETGSESVRALRDRATMDNMRERASNLRQNLRTTGTNFRESSNLTLTRLRSNSSHYASRARTGVAVGLEQVKSHVQSMKELCGTGGEPGTSGMHTISVATLDTDHTLDTDVDVHDNKDLEVVKSNTII